MVKSKTKITKCSSYIARAVVDNNEKFKIIAQLYQKHKDLVSKKDEFMLKIMGIYRLGFKNFSKGKKLLANLQINAMDTRSYYATPRGITRNLTQRGYPEDLVRNLIAQRVDNDLKYELIMIRKNAKLFKKNLNEQQRKIFNGFFEKVNLLCDEQGILLKLNKPIKIIDINAGFDKPYYIRVIDELCLKSNKIKRHEEFDFNLFYKGKLIVTLRFSKLYLSSGINEKIYIEQIFNPLRVLLKKEISNRQKEIKRLNLFYSHIKNKFANYILLETIERDAK